MECRSILGNFLKDNLGEDSSKNWKLRLYVEVWGFRLVKNNSLFLNMNFYRLEVIFSVQPHKIYICLLDNTQPQFSSFTGA